MAELQRCWAEAEALGRTTKEIADQCALLCCVQQELGYFAALHEGAVGSGSVVSRAPSLPLILTWEGANGADEVYSRCLASDAGSSTLLQQLLACVKRATEDRRWGMPANRSKLTAKVSLLRDFADITETPHDWTPGEHGLWYSLPGNESVHVYAPDVVKHLAADAEEEEDDAVRRVLTMMVRSRETAEGEEVGEPALPLPEGAALYRFGALTGECSLSVLPTMRRRAITNHNAKEMLLAQTRMQELESQGKVEPQEQSFAALTATSDDERVRAFIVPSSGAYMNGHLKLASLLSSRAPAGIDRVRRIFVIAPVWDCYIDGCGLPERRCAWYGKVPLDLVVLETLRSSKAFVELSVEQDQRERAIEALLPLVDRCFREDQEFTLVPVLVGGLMSAKAERYIKLLAPYLADATNLFVVAGSVADLGNELNLEQPTDLGDGPERWMRNAATSEADGFSPMFDALKLFLAVLAQAPQRLDLRLTRF